MPQTRTSEMIFGPGFLIAPPVFDSCLCAVASVSLHRNGTQRMSNRDEDEQEERDMTGASKSPVPGRLNSRRDLSDATKMRQAVSFDDGSMWAPSPPMRPLVRGGYGSSRDLSDATKKREALRAKIALAKQMQMRNVSPGTHHVSPPTLVRGPPQPF